MIAKFDTSSTGTKTNSLIYIGGAIVLGYLIYRFVIKPKMDKSKEPKQ